jgi:hypothetical protein
MLRRVALLTTDISEDCNTSIIKVTRVGELGTTLGVTNNRRTLGRHNMNMLNNIKIVFIRSGRRLLITVNFVASSTILVILMMAALISSETSVVQDSRRVTSQKTAFFWNKSNFRNAMFFSHSELRTLYEVHNPSDSEHRAPPSEPFSFYFVTA